ncbi:hypothetical protein [Dyella sp.]|uniref:hypothetical protein n=1 Tax=Dyella sp. TaxID=1869338 RepID=UPI002ED46151
MLDFCTGQVLKLLARTAPFVALRLLVYVGISLAYTVVVGIGAGLGFVAGKIGGAADSGVFWGGLLGFGLVSGVLFWAREYLLYLVKAGHVAVLVELLEGREVPAGKSQIEYGRDMVHQHFAASSMLFGLNQLVRGILRVFHRVTVNVAEMLPIPGLDSVVKIFDAVIKTALGSLDQVILGQILRQRADDPWITARDSVVLYAQNYRGILKNALALTFVVWGLTFVLFLLVLGPVAALVALVPKLAGFWTFALAAVVAVSLKAALIDPFAMTALLQVYAKQTTGQVPHPEWTHRLEQMSDKFRELVQKARATARPAATPSASASASMPD